MTVTASPNDKYAFLFAGPTVARFVRDLENVALTLVEYYNYPPLNIMVVLGSTPAPMPGFSGAPVTTIGSETQLSTALTSFASMAAGTNKTALLYFTGGSIPPPTGSTDSKLVITGGTTPASVDAAWLAPKLAALHPAHINVVMQQGHARGFEAAVTTLSTTVPTNEWSFTYACEANQDSYGLPSTAPDFNGSFFTAGWTRALQLEALPVGATGAGQFADELGSGSEAANRQVSLQEAMVFAKRIHDEVDLMGAFSTIGYTGPAVGGAQHLGKPTFLIRDGTPWWESPDIFLTHPNDSHVDLDPSNRDLYIPDSPTATAPFNNTINVVVRNVGSHPVRAYALHEELFHTGGGGTSIANDVAPVVPTAGLLLPIDLADIGTLQDKTDTYLWNTIFVETHTHRCVKAEVGLLASDISTGWSVQANDTEAQRNIDVMVTVSSNPSPLPLPTIQGTKEHMFGLQNRLEETGLFLLAMPKEFPDLQERFGLKWFGLAGGLEGERYPLEPKWEPVPHIPFRLEFKEETLFVLHVDLRPEVELEREVRLPFEIWAEGDWPRDARPLFYEVDMPGFAPIAGFTVVLQAGAGTLIGSVLGRDGEALPEAKVHLRTLNRLQRATIWTDGEGRFALKDINPDVYHIWAEGRDLRSEVQTVVLLRERKEDVRLVLTEEPGELE